jgi:hypothetical protein
VLPSTGSTSSGNGVIFSGNGVQVAERSRSHLIAAFGYAQAAGARPVVEGRRPVVERSQAAGGRPVVERSRNHRNTVFTFFHNS